MSQIRTGYQIFLTILDKMTQRNMVIILYIFLFGKSNSQIEKGLKKDEEQAKMLLDHLDDEPLNLLEEFKSNQSEQQDVSPNEHNTMSLELSKLNFKAKNQASGLSIHEPFANR